MKKRSYAQACAILDELTKESEKRRKAEEERRKEKEAKRKEKEIRRIVDEDLQ